MSNNEAVRILIELEKSGKYSLGNFGQKVN